MAEAGGNLDCVKAAKGLEVIVTLRRYREFRVRCWLAMRLIRLAMWVANFALTVNAEDLEEGTTDGEAGLEDVYRATIRDQAGNDIIGFELPQADVAKLVIAARGGEPTDGMPYMQTFTVSGMSNMEGASDGEAGA